MGVFHRDPDAVTPALASPRSQAMRRLEDGLRRLSEEGLAREDFERFEREVHALFNEAEREVLGHELEALDIELPYVILEGRRYRRVLRSTETYTSAAGPLQVKRTLYRAGSERSVVPIELRAGIVEGHWTPLAARHGAWVVAHLTPGEGEGLFAELGNMRPSKSSLDRLAKGLGARWEGDREAFEAALRERLEIPTEAATVALSLDGVLVPMKDGSREAKRARTRAEGRPTKGPAGYQEAGCATVSFYDANGERLGTVRMGRMPEPKKATLKASLTAEIEAVLAKRPDLEVVKLADGARDNWTYLDALVPEGVSFVDFYHGAQHLKAALDAAYGENSPKAQAHFAKHRRVLLEDPDGVEKVIRALVYLRGVYPRRQRIGEVLGYFRRNRHRMRYADGRAHNLPIGSGVVEAACKTLATQRLKRSGMRWRHPGGQAILTLRALIQSDRFAAGWRMMATTYRTDVTPPNNVVQFTRKQAA